jgi:ABC-type molybdate transport system substrate-binding protein
MAKTIRVISSLGTREVIEAIAPDFERTNTCTIARVYDSSVGLLKRASRSAASTQCISRQTHSCPIICTMSDGRTW